MKNDLLHLVNKHKTPAPLYGLCWCILWNLFTGNTLLLNSRDSRELETCHNLQGLWYLNLFTPFEQTTFKKRGFPNATNAMANPNFLLLYSSTTRWPNMIRPILFNFAMFGYRDRNSSNDSIKVQIKITHSWFWKLLLSSFVNTTYWTKRIMQNVWRVCNFQICMMQKLGKSSNTPFIFDYNNFDRLDNGNCFWSIS